MDANKEPRDWSSDLPRLEFPNLLVDSIAIGERQIAAGETFTHEEAKERIKKWLTPSTRS